MLEKLPFQHSDTLYLSIQDGTTAPVYFRVSTLKIQKLILFTFFTFFILLLLSLFFFREVELNRTLTQKVLELETDNLVVQLQKSRVPFSIKKEVEAPIKEPSVTEIPASNPARLSHLLTNCTADSCEVKVSLIPGQQGVSEGNLLLVLELEVPKIGSSHTQQRKKYVVYPGIQSLDDFNSENISSLEKKSFRFSKGLQTTAVFQKDKLFIPLAINLYLLDNDNNITLHERRAIEYEVSDAP